MIKKNELKTIIISFALIIAVDLIYVVIDTVFQLTDIELGAPLSRYLLYGYSSLAVTGFYIGWAKTDSKTKICFLACLFYIFKRIVLDNLLASNLNGDLQSSIVIILNLTALSFLILLGSNTLSRQVKRSKST